MTPKKSRQDTPKPIPLAEKLRPKTLAEFVGQNELVSTNQFLTKMIKEDQISSMIFWGPPGSGKTTLANIIAHETKANFKSISGVVGGKEDLKKIIAEANSLNNLGTKTILFLDEIHRWNKAQQDALLPWVEKGTIILIGATTENPSFSLNNALLSRMRVLVLHELTPDNINQILEKAIIALQQQNSKLSITKDAITLISKLSNGDARMAINTLEICSWQNQIINPQLVTQILQKTNLRYDKNGEEHYNIISALHKSLRGNDPNAALYWLARMLEGGEDPLYICRRLIRFASEDIGLADNFALILTNSVYETCKNIGWPECNVALSQAIIYLARAPKSILAYQAYNLVKKDVTTHGNLPVPLHLRNAPTKLMKKLNYGQGYKYTPLENSSQQEYLPPELKNKKYI
ncbi:MAG: replication-associated recombination protein A [Patescibacteria group bacterium]